MATLESIRDEITQLDGDLLRLLARRKRLSIEVARSKQADRRPIRDQIREQELLETLIQHNESDIKTWIPLEYDLQMTYGNEQVKFSDYLTELREQVRADSVRKIEKSVH